MRKVKNSRFGKCPGSQVKGMLFVVIFMLLSAGISFAEDAPQFKMMSGTIEDDGTVWALVVPEPVSEWNGSIILDLDGSRVKNSLTDHVKWFLEQGYAYGGITRSPVNYNFTKAVDYLLTVRDLFISEYGKTPERTIAMGASRGGFVARLCMERKPEIFDAALVMAGGGAGEIAVLNSKLDSLFVLKTLVDPSSPMQMVGVPNNGPALGAESAAFSKLFALADSTPEGKARIAFAAAVEYFGTWTVRNTPEPAPQDFDSQYAQLTAELPPPFINNFIFANPIVVRAPIEELAGGIVSWNHGVDYEQLLNNSGRKSFVVAMYEKAGLGREGLEADLKKLKKAARISADPAAVSKAEKIMSYTGKIEGPILNMDTTGDPVDPKSMKIVYSNKLQEEGNGDLFRLVWLGRPGHSSQSSLEIAAAATALINRLDSGKWSETTPDAMKKLAEEVAAGSAYLTADDTTFTSVPSPGRFIRTWDSSNWDSYTGK